MDKVLVKNNLTGEIFEATPELAKLLTDPKVLLDSMSSTFKEKNPEGIYTSYGFYTSTGTYYYSDIKKGVYSLLPNTPASKVLFG